ncbi:MAG: TolC family protein [Niabella sp.]
MKGLITILLLLPMFRIGAQDSITISLTELLGKIESQNLQVRLQEQDVKTAEAELLQSRAMYLPNVTASYTAMATNNPLMAFGSKLNQARVTMSDFDPANLNDPGSVSNFATKLEVQQPIINMDAVYQKKAGQVKTTVHRLKAEWTKDYLQFEANKAYMQLQLSYKMLEALYTARQATLAHKAMIDQYYKNGLVQQADVLQVGVRVTEIENQLQMARSNIRNASDYISFLLNEDYGEKVFKPENELVYEPQLFPDTHPQLNKSRKDLQSYDKSLEIYDYMLKSARSKSLPRLNAFGSFEMYDKSAMQFGANGYMAGIQLSWNLFDGLRSKSEQSKYRAELNKAETGIAQYQKQSQLELNKSYRQVLDAANKVSLGKQAWEQAKEAYRIRKNRFGQGLEKTTDLLMAETQMSQKELEYQQAIFEYNVAAAHFKFLN